MARRGVRERVPGAQPGAKRRYRRDTGKSQLVLAPADRDTVLAALDHLTVPRRHGASGRRRPQADARRHHVGAVLAQRHGPAQPRLAEPGDDQSGAVIDCLPCEFALDVGTQPAAWHERRVEGVGLRRQVQRHYLRRIESVDEVSVDRDRTRVIREAELRRDQRCHHVDRHRGGLLEHPQFTPGLFGDVGVVGIKRRLLCSADDEHRGAKDQHRPQHLRLRGGQRADGMEGPHPGKDRGRIGARMPEHRRHRDRQLGHRPAVRQVAEIDDTIRVHGSVRTSRNDDIGVRQVEVGCLPGQAVGQRVYPRPRRRRKFLHPRPLQRIADMRKQFCHNVRAVSQIPLKRAVQTGMVETGQRTTDASGHFAQPRHRGRG